jgi:hypothetical protein
MHNATETDFYFKGGKDGPTDTDQVNTEGTHGGTVEIIRGGITERYSGYVSDYEKAQGKAAIDEGPADKANLPDGVRRAVTTAERLRFFAGVARMRFEHPKVLAREVDLRAVFSLIRSGDE